MQHMCNVEVKYIKTAQPKAIMLFNISPAKARQMWHQLGHSVKQDYAHADMRFRHAEFGLPVHGWVDVSCVHKLPDCPIAKLANFQMDSVPHVRKLIEDTPPALTAGWSAVRCKAAEKPTESEVFEAVNELKRTGLISRFGDVGSLSSQLTLEENVSSSLMARALMLTHLMMEVNTGAQNGIIDLTKKTKPAHIDGSVPEGLRPSHILWGVKTAAGDGVHARLLEVPEIMSILGYNPRVYNLAGMSVSSAQRLISLTMPVSVVLAASLVVTASVQRGEEQ